MKRLTTFIGLGVLAFNTFSIAPAQADCYAPPSGIVGWWPAEGNANDIVGGNNGVLMNGTGFTNGEVGTAFNFNGVNNFVLINPTSSILDVGQSDGFTIEGWINPTTVANDMIMIEYERTLGTGNGSDVGMEFSIHQTTLAGAGVGCLYANVLDVTQTSHLFTSPANLLVAGVWQHIALTYDKASGNAALYINGEAVTQTNLGSFTPQTSFTNFLIGARTYLGSASSPNTAFSGAIDEFSIYNRALSSNEIAAIYNASSSGKCDAGPFPPEISVQPVGQTVLEGSNVVLSVIAAGTGPFNYQWIFNGKKLAGATNATLNLGDLHAYQSGNYSVTVSTTVGAITSSVVTVTVIAQDILVYKYSGTTTITTAGVSLTYAYSGELFYIPAITNGTFVAWSVINKQKEYGTSSLTDYLAVTIPGPGKQTFTILGLAGQEIDDNGYPHIWSYLHKGINTSLDIAKKRTFSFPDTFSCDETHIYPDSQTGNMILDESMSTYTFLPQNTQTANNTGQTMIDLVNALTNSLVRQGYHQQQN